VNIIVICCDTFRYDHLGFVGRQHVLTPNLDQLARESACFTDYFLCSFPTLPNRIEVFSGRTTFPVFDWGPQPYQFPVLAEVFKRHKYTTALFSDNPHLAKKNFGFERGFDFVRNVPGQAGDRSQPATAPMIDLPCAPQKLDPRPHCLERYRRNAHYYRQRGTNTTEVLYADAMRWLDSAPDKFFLWIDSFDPHEPWDAPPRFRDLYPRNPEGDEVIWPRSGGADRYAAAEVENMRSLYKAEISQADHWIGRLLDHLTNRNLLGNTAVIFCSDHGYYLGEHGLVGKLRLGRPTPIYEEVGHVPLLVRHPAGVAAGRRISGLCQPPDLFPTCLDLAGLSAVGWTQGHSLVPRLAGQPGQQCFAVSGGHPGRKGAGCLSVWTDQWCFIYSPHGGLSNSELYHRPSDLTQTQNVIAAHPDVAARQRQLLLDWLKPFRLPAARQRRLLHDSGFRWRDEISGRIDRWRKRCVYHWRFHNYTLTG
jgi:arylsulfatase A-like enzyme